MEYIGDYDNDHLIQYILFTCWLNCVNASYEASTSTHNASTEQETKKKKII
jgi:hypothetical protein